MRIARLADRVREWLAGDSAGVPRSLLILLILAILMGWIALDLFFQILGAQQPILSAV